eukprot:14800076-Alexandrium_andersonii.AAC.1
MVRAFRLKKTFREDRKKLTVHLDEKPLEEEFLRALQTLGGDLRLGVAPPTEMERALQKQLEAGG